MTTTPPSSAVITLTTAEIAKRIRAHIATTFTLETSAYIVQSASRRGHIDIAYLNGPTQPEMEALVEKYQRGYHHEHYAERTFTEPGQPQRYRSQSLLSIACTRHITSDFTARCLQVYCRRLHAPLPEIVQGRIQTNDAPFKQELYAFMARTSETALATLELEAVALAPPPEPCDEQIRQRDAEAEQRRVETLRSYETARQQALFRVQVYEHLQDHERVQKLLTGLESLAQKMRALAPASQDLLVCSRCFAATEKGTAHALENTFVCPTCVQQSPLPSPHHPIVPQELSDEESAAPSRAEDDLSWAKNGERAPILTRDLLEEIRFGIWWLAFERKPGEAVRQALRQAGWDWSPSRQQWFHPNKFGMVPPILFEVYGGYLDAGFSVYREQRGERLRAAADHLEERAEHAWDRSNAIVEQSLPSGTLLIGPRSTRSLHTKKARAESLAQATRALDVHAHTLHARASRSETHQQRVTQTPLLLRVIKRLEAEARKEERDFHQRVVDAACALHDPGSSHHRDLPTLLAAYAETERRKEVIQEEVDWLRAVIEERRATDETETMSSPVVSVPALPQRAYAIERIIEVPVGRDNPLDLYPTPPALGDQLLRDAALLPIPATARLILEPHGGTGSLLRCIERFMQERVIQAELHTCELNLQLHEDLRQRGYQVVGANFLDYQPDVRYDAIIANPPFSTWLAQVMHMLDLLTEGGILNVILPRSFLSDRSEHTAFRQYVEEQGTWIEIEGGTFHEAGTNVPVVLVSLQKQHQAERA